MAKKTSRANRKPLTPGLVQRIVVANTPDHPQDPAPNTQLRTWTLGVTVKAAQK